MPKRTMTLSRLPSDAALRADIANTDPALCALLDEHTVMLRQWAEVLKKVGPGHPQRSRVNHRRSVIRAKLKRQLPKLEHEIVARCHFLFPSR